MVPFSRQKETRQPFDYSNSAMILWGFLGVQGPRIEVAKKQDRGVILAKGCDLNYFESKGHFGNAANSLVDCSLNKVGELFSRAYNNKESIDHFMNTDYHPNIIHADLSDMYRKLKEFAASKGYKENFDITAFGSGFLPDSAGAGVFPLPKDFYFFKKNKEFSKWLKNFATDYNVEYDSAALYLMMHEFTHLFGVDGDIKGERALESIINDFADKMIKEIYNAGNLNEKRKIELARTLRQIKRIASIRYGEVNENYGERNIVSELRESYSQNALETLISEFTKEAASMNMTKEGIMKYVNKKLKEIKKKSKSKYNTEKTSDYKTNNSNKKKKTTEKKRKSGQRTTSKKSKSSSKK